MATKLKEFDWDVRSRNANPLDKFLDGAIWKLNNEDRARLGMELGNHEGYYHGLPNLRNALYARGRLLGKGVRTKAFDNAIVVQAYDISETDSN
jgi:hypothetical protein